jgi:2-iminobutanoate/2-iminopropanoate deaminase
MARAAMLDSFATAFCLPSPGTRFTLAPCYQSSDQEFFMNRRVWILFVALGLSTVFTVRGAFSQGEAQSKRRAINLPDKPVQAPFSNAILAGDTLYLAGSIGLDPKSGKAPEKIEDEIKLLLDGYKATLAAGGMTMDDLVYVQVFCTDLAYYDKFNAAYRTYFAKDFPARAFVGAGSLLRGGHFEMQAIAVRH